MSRTTVKALATTVVAISLNVGMCPNYARAGSDMILITAGAVMSALGQNARAGSDMILITATNLFDGFNFATSNGMSVLTQGGKIVQVGPAGSIVPPVGTPAINVPGGTILPGIIDMHTHHIVNSVPVVRMMEHGITTARDLGGPLTPVDTNKPFKLRQILSGPIITTPGGYPMPVFPAAGVEVRGVAAVRAKVDDLISNGSKVITLSLEPGGEAGAPWTSHMTTTPPPWPTLSDAEVKAIVQRAHEKGKRVVAYVGESTGVARAIGAGIDEWAHMPCLAIDPALWSRIKALPADKKPTIGGTLDTMVACPGVAENAASAMEAGIPFIYGTDLGHPDIPNGADAQEIHQEVHAWLHTHATATAWVDGMTNALASATGRAGNYLYAKREIAEENLGRLIPGAPADIIVIGSDPRVNFKEIEYPRAVISAGKLVFQRSAGE